MKDETKAVLAEIEGALKPLADGHKFTVQSPRIIRAFIESRLARALREGMSEADVAELRRLIDRHLTLNGVPFRVIEKSDDPVGTLQRGMFMAEVAMEDEMSAAAVLTETWRLGAETETVFAVGGGCVVPDVYGVQAQSGARARVIACAPEAMRLLLEAEWEGMVASAHQAACPWCEYLDTEGHGPNCRWLALMKKAGLR